MVDLQKKHSPLLLLFAKVAAVLLGLALLGIGARLAYARFFPDILVARARGALAKGDLRGAALAAQRAFQIRRTDIDAMRLIADVADQSGQYVALEWRKTIVETLPDSLPDNLACAATALRCGQAEVAKETLAKAKGASGNARYWALRASTDSYLGDLDDAEHEADEATRLDPKNEDYQITRAAVELKTQRIELRAEARATLEALMKEPRRRLAAERLLIEDSVANSELSSALKFGEVIAGEKESQFFDKLTYLSVPRAVRRPKVPRLSRGAGSLREFHPIRCWHAHRLDAERRIESTGV